jgi:hypothetical protein
MAAAAEAKSNFVGITSSLLFPPPAYSRRANLAPQSRQSSSMDLVAKKGEVFLSRAIVRGRTEFAFAKS